MFSRIGGVLTGILMLGIAACGDAPVTLNGGGATFPYPLYTAWMSDYHLKTGVEINYQSIGSGGGIRQFSEQTFDFGASDGPMSDDEIAKAKGGEVLHIPTVLGAVAIAYHLPDLTDTLNFDGALIADIFLGKITKWNDPRIAALNPAARLPDMPISVVHRTDGSGTTYVFTEFLTKASPAWAAGPGHGKDVSWPLGLGGKGNEQVAGTVKSTPGTIGYVESVYAKQSSMAVGRVKNRAGNFVAPTPASINAAAADVIASLPENTDYRVSVVDPAAADAYPIASFTWLLVYRNQTDPGKARTLKDFLKWAVTEGQARAAELHYGPLPDTMRPGLLRHIDSIREN